MLARRLIALLVLVGCGRGDAKESLPPASAVPPPSVPSIAPPPAMSVSADESGGGIGIGTTRAKVEAKIAAKASGVISEIAVEEGDRVKKGAVLFRLDARQQALAVEQAKVGMRAAEVALKAAELDLKRVQELSSKQAAPPAALDQAQSRHDQAKVGVDQAKVGLAMAQKALADTSATAPFDGVISAKFASVGESVTMMPATIVVVLQDDSELEVRARLPESALATVEPGDGVEVKIPSVNKKVKAKLERVNPSVDLRTRTIEVVVRIDNADKKLRPGMMAELLVDGVQPAKDKK